MDMGFAPVQKAKANTPVPGIMDLKYPDHTLGRVEARLKGIGKMENAMD
jgi:hypothetical protein